MFTLNPETEKRVTEKAGPSRGYWSKFLHARALLIASMREQGKTDQEIYEAISMDGPDQVTSIRIALEIP